LVRWVEDTALANKILADIASELEEGQKEYLSRLPHVSELVYCLTRSAYNRLKPLPPNQRETMLFATGIGLEQVVLRPHRTKEHGELDGIHWSADWVDYVEGLGELKSTRLSANKGADELPETWKKQMMAYMKAKGVTEASLAVLHLMGNYAPPFPELRAWHMYAEQWEIDENWDWLLQRKAIYLDHVERNEVPKQFRYNEDWECTYCRYKLICDAFQQVEDLSPQLEESIRLVKGDRVEQP
jgi:hypothetical protein